MRQANNYISSSRAISLLNQGFKFNQDLSQSEFKLIKQGAEYKLNKKNADQVKEFLKQERKQMKLI